VVCLAAAVAGGLLLPVARATTYDWDGSKDSTWSNKENWTPKNNPGSGDVAEWNNVSYKNAVYVDANASIGELLFLSGKAVTFGSSKNTLTIYGMGGAGIQVDSGCGAVDLNNTKIFLQNAQTWQNDSANTLTISGTVDNNTKLLTLTGSGAGNILIEGVISDTGGLTVDRSGTGAVVLTGMNTYSGGTTLSAGKLTFGNTKAIGTGTLVINGGTLDSSVANLVNANNNVQNWNGDFAFAGSQNLNLGTGAVTMNARRQVTVSAGTLAVGGVIADSGYGLTKAGAGALTLYGANTFSGNTLISGGTLTVSNNLALQNSAFDTTGAGTLAFGTGVTTPTFGGLVGASNLTVAAGVTALTINPGSGVTNTYTGALGSDTAGMTLTKTGSGVQVLAGANTYSGNTTISTGTLQIGNGGTGGSLAGSITVSNSAFLVFNKSGSYTTANTITGGGTNTLTGLLSGFLGTTVVTNATVYFNQSGSYGGLLVADPGSYVGGTGNIASLLVQGVYSPGNSPGTQTVASLTISNGGTLKMDLVQTNNHDLVIVTNAFSLNQTAYLQLAITNASPFDIGDRFVLVDNTYEGLQVDGTNQFFVLKDYLADGITASGFNGLILTNGAEFMAIGGGTVTNAFRINYDALANGETGYANDVVLTVVPEPGTLALGLFVSLPILLRFWVIRRAARRRA